MSKLNFNEIIQDAIKQTLEEDEQLNENSELDMEAQENESETDGEVSASMPGFDNGIPSAIAAGLGAMNLKNAIERRMS